MLNTKSFFKWGIPINSFLFEIKVSLNTLTDSNNFILIVKILVLELIEFLIHLDFF
jgi:hypothetical protein